MKNKNDRILRVVFIPVFTALTAVGAQISIPIGNVPITLQMLFVFLAGFMLKPYDALISMLLYLTLGGAGLPVFANFSGGAQHLVGPTAGYLWAFPISAFVIGFLKKNNQFLAGIVGLLIVYLLGWAWLGISINNFTKAFIVGVLPFVPIDLIKMFIALYVWKKSEKIIGGIVNEET
ncbi:MAG: biotin transporter BioY [Fervidobacterium sp.]